MIYVYNSHQEDFTNKSNNFYIGRGSPLGNPFSHNGVRSVFKTLTFKTREEAIEAYDKYFDKMYGNNEEFTKAFDEIYKHYKNGEDVYLQCFCKPKPMLLLFSKIYSYHQRYCKGSVTKSRLQEKCILF